MLLVVLLVQRCSSTETWLQCMFMHVDANNLEELLASDMAKEFTEPAQFRCHTGVCMPTCCVIFFFASCVVAFFVVFVSVCVCVCPLVLTAVFAALHVGTGGLSVDRPDDCVDNRGGVAGPGDARARPDDGCVDPQCSASQVGLIDPQASVSEESPIAARLRSRDP